MRANHEGMDKITVMVELLITFSRELRKNKALNEDQINEIREISKYRSNTNQTILHIIGADQNSFPIFHFIMVTSTILRVEPDLIKCYDDMQYTPLCTVLSKICDTEPSNTNYVDQIELVKFLIEKGASCKPVFKFEKLHAALGIALHDNETFFCAVKNTFIESKTYEAHSLLYRWRIIRKVAKIESLNAINDAMETYLIENEKQCYELFKNTLRALLNLKYHEIVTAPNTEMENLVKVRISNKKHSAGEDNTGILYFICSMMYIPNHHIHQLEYLVLKLVKTKGIDIQASDFFGKTALHLAASHGYNNFIRFIIQHPKHNFNATDNMGNTPLHHAIECKKIDTVQLLIKAGYNVNTPNSSLSCPLHIAVSENSPEIVKLLLQNNASTVIKNQYDETPLDLANASTRHVDKQIHSLLINAQHQKSSPVQKKQLPKCCILL